MNEEKALIHAAMVAVMKDVGAITKARKNTQQGYSFRGIDDMYNALHDIMAKHGVFTLPTVLDIQRGERESKSGGVLITTVAKVQYRFYATDGSYLDAVLYGEGMDSGDKSSNKALAGAHKYALVQSFAIPTEAGDDSENENPEPAPRQIPPAAQAMISDITKMLANSKMAETEKDVYRKRMSNAHTMKALDEIRSDVGSMMELDSAAEKGFTV